MKNETAGLVFTKLLLQDPDLMIAVTKREPIWFNEIQHSHDEDVKFDLLGWVF
jgi:hypothetical protein